MLALVALGSNLGERRRHLERGLQALAELGTVTVSPLWPATPDVTGVGPDYLNTVAMLETAGTDPCALLEALLRAELRLGRDRGLGRNAPLEPARALGWPVPDAGAGGAERQPGP
jgi:2-amino-4-hydroxy-6-hydroxymethyldihydropteridine diphosphokinase